VSGEPVHHESAPLHVSGGAFYADDIELPAGTLHAALGLSRPAHARLRQIDLTAVRAAPGVVAVAAAADVPGANDCGPILADEPIFADGLVQHAGQSIFGVAAGSMLQARKAARLGRVEYDELPAILDIRAALAQNSFVIPTQRLVRGDPRGALARAPQRLKGSVAIGGQDHFSLEGQIAVALPQENAGILVYSSTQHPSEVQHKVAHALGRHAHQVTVQCRRMGGGFGGKESRPALMACAAAVLAAKTGRPVKLRMDRDDDMLVSGKRHDFIADYEVGFDERPTTRIQGHLETQLRRLGSKREVTHRWAGTMGFTDSGLPLVGPVDGMPNVYLCAGYNGHGMGFAFMSAKQLVASL